jgi:hypothetical protein
MLKVRSGSLLLCTVLLLLASLSPAADKKQLSEALAAVEANLKTSAGKQYDASLGSEFSAKYMSNLKQCKQSIPAGSSTDPFDMFLKLDGRGKVQDALVYPETPLALCARTALLAGQFSAPPHGDYWINVHMEPKR